VFIDGSCSLPSIIALARAGWAIEFVAALYGVVLDEFVQQSGATELWAVYQLIVAAPAPPPKLFSGYTDSLAGLQEGGLVLLAREDSLVPRIWVLIFCKLRDHGGGWTVDKVGAHSRCPEVEDDAWATQLKQGNDLADEYAKKGAKLHFYPEDLLADLTFAQKEARGVAQAAAVALAAWAVTGTPQDCERPSVTGARCGRPKCQLADSREWRYLGPSRVCKGCGRRVAGGAGKCAAARTACPGKLLLAYPEAVLGTADKHVLHASAQRRMKSWTLRGPAQLPHADLSEPGRQPPERSPLQALWRSRTRRRT